MNHPDPTGLALLRDAESYLSALHGSVARHDNLAANLGCAGCELRNQIAAELCRAAAVSVPPPAPRADARAAVDLADGPVRCPLCVHTVTLHTPNGARAHFTAVHPEQRVTGRGHGPWPLLVTDGAEAQSAVSGPCVAGEQQLPSIHANDVQGFCPACGHPTLYLGEGGHLTCSLMDCPKPEAADALLHDGSGEQQNETPERRCVCPHRADEHSVYGCVDGCGCEWMPKRPKLPPMDPVHILGIEAPE